MGPARVLSTNLSNENIQGLATSMRLFAVVGKMGWYARALDYLESQLATSSAVPIYAT